MAILRPYDASKHFDAVLELYASVNWSAYTDHPEKLRKALQNSYSVHVAIVESELVGLIRTLSDGEVISYIMDVLVHPEYQRKGVGRELVNFVLANNSVRQFVLLTDDEPKQKAFYESLGFSLVQGKLNAFVILQNQ